MTDETVYFDDADGEKIEISKADVFEETSVERLKEWRMLLHDEEVAMASLLSAYAQGGIVNHGLAVKVAAFRKALRWINARLQHLNDATCLDRQANEIARLKELLAQSSDPERDAKIKNQATEIKHLKARLADSHVVKLEKRVTEQAAKLYYTSQERDEARAVLAEAWVVLEKIGDVNLRINRSQLIARAFLAKHKDK